MTEDCGCKPKRRAPTVASAEPRARKFKYFSEIIWFVAGVFIAYAAIKFVAPQQAVCNSAELESRIVALEQHSTMVDSKFHRSLDEKTKTRVVTRITRPEALCLRAKGSSSTTIR